jgi:hypothetical protein
MSHWCFTSPFEYVYSDAQVAHMNSTFRPELPEFQTLALSADTHPSAIEWELLADADAEYRDWLCARHANDVDALEADENFQISVRSNAA